MELIAEAITETENRISGHQLEKLLSFESTNKIHLKYKYLRQFLSKRSLNNAEVDKIMK